jgi:hypothetical protein
MCVKGEIRFCSCLTDTAHGPQLLTFVTDLQLSLQEDDVTEQADGIKKQEFIKHSKANRDGVIITKASCDEWKKCV